MPAHKTQASIPFDRYWEMTREVDGKEKGEVSEDAYAVEDPDPVGVEGDGKARVELHPARELSTPL